MTITIEYHNNFEASCNLNNLELADDIALFSNTADELQQVVEDLNRINIRVGFKIIVQNRNVMFIGLARKQEFMIPRPPLESV